MSEKYYKRMYSVGEQYVILYEAMRSIKYLRKARKNDDIDEKFMERIMLAVTEVNGCEVCSYYHTEAALKSGMSDEEISAMLSGDTDNVPNEQSVAIFFAQHYADKKGKPSKDAWQRVIKIYGEIKALGILGAIRMIMMGNASGIALSAFRSRLKGKKVEKSSLGYELATMLSLITFIPAAIVHSFLANLIKRPLIRFE